MDEEAAGLLVVRGGINTLHPDQLYAQCLDAHDRLGWYGFSVYIGDDLAELGQCVYNPKLSVARLQDLYDLHCVFGQTGPPPHYTLVVSAELPTLERLTEVAAAFTLKVDNPNPKERRRWP